MTDGRALLPREAIVCTGGAAECQPARMVQLTLYTRAQCPLCHEMRAVIDRVARDVPLAIAVDAMGGDHAPDAVVQGVAQVSLATDIECLLVGDERRIQNVLEGVSYNPEHIAILHATEAIGMAEEPREAVKRRDSSLLVGVRAVAEGRAEAFVSAGNTGACVLACAKHFRLLRGIRRAALASVYPRQREQRGQDPLALLLDVGATVRCEPEELVHFAL